jgi:rhomboid protease GluP
MALSPKRTIKETWLSRKPRPSSVWIVVLGVGLLLISGGMYWQNDFGFANLLPASKNAVFIDKEYWRLFTAILAHADIGHLLSNMLFWSVLSLLLFDYYGFFVFPVSSILLGAATNYLVIQDMAPEARLVGASQVVYAMAGIWLALYLFVEGKHTPAIRLVRALGFSLAMLMPSAFDPSISYEAHALGFLLGFGFGVFLVFHE